MFLGAEQMLKMVTMPTFTFQLDKNKLRVSGGRSKETLSSCGPDNPNVSLPLASENSSHDRFGLVNGSRTHFWTWQFHNQHRLNSNSHALPGDYSNQLNQVVGIQLCVD